jgi:hypothetical protein
MKTPCRDYAIRPIRKPVDSAYLVTEAILTQLHKDAIKSRITKCEAYPEHPVRDCALTMLHRFEDFMLNNEGADVTEIAMELISYHYAK